MDAHRCAAMLPDLLYFTFSRNNLHYVGSYRRLPSMLVVLIVLLLLTALVATEPSSPGGGDS